MGRSDWQQSLGEAPEEWPLTAYETHSALPAYYVATETDALIAALVERLVDFSTAYGPSERLRAKRAEAEARRWQARQRNTEQKLGYAEQSYAKAEADAEKWKLLADERWEQCKHESQMHDEQYDLWLAAEQKATGLAAELAALKARTCSTCSKWTHVSELGSDYRHCETWGQTTSGEVSCSFWAAREQP